MNSTQKTSSLTLEGIRKNTGAWKSTSRDNKFRLLNNGAYVSIDRELYDEIMAQRGNKETMRMYLAIEASDTANFRLNNLDAYLIFQEDDGEITEDNFDSSKVFTPKVVGEWLGDDYENSMHFSLDEHGKGEKEINAKKISYDKINFKLGDDVNEDERLRMIERFFKWKIYGRYWRDNNPSNEEAVQALEFNVNNLIEIFTPQSDEEIPTLEAALFFSISTREGYENRIELIFCGKREEITSEDSIEAFLDFYNFKNVTTPFPPFKREDRTFSLIDSGMQPPSLV